MPFLADISVPWIIVAMIFISFVRFIMERIRGPEEEEEFDEEEWQRRMQGEPSSPEEAGRPPARPSIDPADELRRFLETLREGEPQGGETSVPTPAPVEAATPPPPPPPPRVRKKEERVKTKVSAKQHAAAEAFRAHSTSPSKTRHAAASPRSVAALLSQPDSIRDAIVLAEVLGPPKALRPHEDPWNG